MNGKDRMTPVSLALAASAFAILSGCAGSGPTAPGTSGTGTTGGGTTNPPPATSQSVCSGMSLGANAPLNGYVPFPASNAFNTNIANTPDDPQDNAITSAAGFAGLHLHADWSTPADGDYGIPYIVVDSSTTPLVNVSITDYASESDVAAAPVPPNAPIEGSPADCTGWPNTYVGDSHMLIVDRNTCFLYEFYNTHRCNGQYSASSETIWDLTTNEQRPWGWTSSDAAGLSVWPLLVKYDEVASGQINHALRFTMQDTRDDANDGYFVQPASHAAGSNWGTNNIMGMRIRLKPTFDISGFSPTNQVILKAMQQYGMILADNGSYGFFQGVPDPRWNDTDLEALLGVPTSAFDVVQMTPVWPGWDSSTAPTGAPPVISSFTASATTVTAGSTVTLTWTTTNDSYDFIDKVGGVRGGKATVTPSATTTYTLNATNQYGRTTKAVTVTVQ